jgi:hypothetical protein
VEFSAGIDPNSNPLPFHEWYFYVFDATPMLFALTLMNLVHPGRILVGTGSEFPKGPSRKEKREAKRAKKDTARARKAERRMAKKHMGASMSQEEVEYVMMEQVSAGEYNSMADRALLRY